MIATKKKEFAESALAATTLAVYRSLANQYEVFCRKRNTHAWPARLDLIEDCTTWLMYTGTPSTANNLWSAIQYFNGEKKYVPLVNSRTLKLLHVKALKLSAQKGRRTMDPIPTEAIVNFCNQGNPFDKDFVAKAALLTLGCRALLRANELARLKIEDISFVSTRIVDLMLPRSLTLQRAVRLSVRASSVRLSLRAVYTRLASGNFVFPQAALLS
jgi:hypothetical protein